MKQFLPALAVLLLVLSLASCSKHNESGSGSPIASSTDAKAAFLKINTLYTSVLRPLLIKKTQTFSNLVLFDSAGQKMIANGKYSTSSYSGSSGSTSSYTIDVTITFQQYSSADLQLNGDLHFYDWYSTRTDCGSAGCATATHKDISYATTDTTTAKAVAIKFNNNGKAISDNINLHADKEYSTFSVALKNAKGQKFSFSY
jgi:hypothetical protein